jgi:hypothetical protein
MIRIQKIAPRLVRAEAAWLAAKRAEIGLKFEAVAAQEAEQKTAMAAEEARRASLNEWGVRVAGNRARAEFGAGTMTFAAAEAEVIAWNDIHEATEWGWDHAAIAAGLGEAMDRIVHWALRGRTEDQQRVVHAAVRGSPHARRHIRLLAQQGHAWAADCLDGARGRGHWWARAR